MVKFRLGLNEKVLMQALFYGFFVKKKERKCGNQ